MAIDFKACNRLRRDGRYTEALELLRSGLRAGDVPPEKLDTAGRFVHRALASEEAPPAASTALLLGQCTTSFVRNSLAAVALRQGVLCRVEEGGYDNVLQDLMGNTASPDVIVLLPWHQRLLGEGARSPEQRIHDEMAFWSQAWSLAGERSSRLVQVGYDWTGPGAEGYSLSGREGPVALVRDMDRALREALPDGAFFVDLQQVSGWTGRDAFYDPRSYFWTKQPFSAAGAARFAEHLWAAVTALLTGPKKVLVLDLDNTLWGGVVGEEGPLGIRLGDSPEGEAYRAFQRYARSLSDRGIVLAACSKNNPEDAREPFTQNPDMVLGLDDFAAFEASWDPKSTALRRISETLRLGLDSFVFVDDNPAERAQVRLALPEVEVPEMGEDPADFARVLSEGLYFEVARVEGADRHRAEQYRAEAQRQGARHEEPSLDRYLASLEMVADIRPIDSADMPRVVQLLGKTNQFNLTTRRHSARDVERLLAEPRALGLTLRLTDRFGDYGLISVVIAVPASDAAARIDTWLMSCRAIARTVEERMLNAIATQARKSGFETLIGDYLPTAKNGLVSDLYRRLGFSPSASPIESGERFELSLVGRDALTTHVALAAAR